MARRLAPHPEPPRDLGRRRLPLVRIAGPLYRIHLARRGAVHFGKTGQNRFDDPLGKYGVLYASSDEYGAFIETAGQSTGRGVVTSAWLRQRVLSQIPLRRRLRLLDLTGRGLARIGADARLFAGDHDVAQRWSRAIWAHRSKPDGIWYPARHDPARLAAAVFGRAKAKLAKPLRRGKLTDPDLEELLDRILDHYGFGLIEH